MELYVILVIIISNDMNNTTCTKGRLCNSFVIVILGVLGLVKIAMAIVGAYTYKSHAFYRMTWKFRRASVQAAKPSLCCTIRWTKGLIAQSNPQRYSHHRDRHHKSNHANWDEHRILIISRMEKNGWLRKKLQKLKST